VEPALPGWSVPLTTTRLGVAAAKVKCVFVLADLRILHIVGQFASGRIELSLTNEGIVRGP
jgi:hypothetical protein